MRDPQAESGSSKIGSRLDNSLDDTGYGWKPPSAACPLLTKRKSTSSRRRGPARWRAHRAVAIHPDPA